MASAEIIVSAVSKFFGTVTALNKCTLALGKSGRCVGVLGRNGAGKTTLLRCLVGLLPIDDGEIEVELNGKRATHADASHAVFIPERCNSIPNLTGLQYFKLHEAMNQLLGVRVDTRLRDDLVGRFMLGPHLHKPCGRMSKGNQRKTEIVAALASDVPLVVADEMAEGLDIPSRLSLQLAVKELAAAGRYFVASSHDLAFIEGTCDYVVIIDQGRCVDEFPAMHDSSMFRDRVEAAFGSSASMVESAEEDAL